MNLAKGINSANRSHNAAGYRLATDRAIVTTAHFAEAFSK
ncbi:hypothetical protein MES5069_350015 [Mesorhizobium escarrei]|uniref:Uncharacterized protein n=1 Tax=Mesorhizobium escarrei TaxID=666018 RepID=A0ABN8JXM4_9HYPH|nr:hypothetical protein MES5069_350015 [Mesorhizobium escarrei]